MNRVRVFLDYRNVYGGAREAFVPRRAPGRAGHINPLAFGELLAARTNPRQPPSPQRVLEQVRIYTGRPDGEKDPRTHAAHMRQCAAWERSGAVVITRPLRYPREWPRDRAQEKGIDVQLAIGLRRRGHRRLVRHRHCLFDRHRPAPGPRVRRHPFWARTRRDRRLVGERQGQRTPTTKTLHLVPPPGAHGLRVRPRPNRLQRRPLAPGSPAQRVMTRRSPVRFPDAS